MAEDGTTHHGAFDFAYLRHMPNMVVMAPKDENELSAYGANGIRCHDGPTAIRYPRGSSLGVPLDPEPVPLGNRPRGVIDLKGRDVAILAIGVTVSEAMKAAEQLKGRWCLCGGHQCALCQAVG